MPNLLTQDVALVGDLKALTGGQVEKVIVGSVARTDTSAKTLGQIPAGATLIGLKVYSPTASDAATTATLVIGKAGGNGHEYLNAYDVKGSGGAGQQNPSTAVLGAVGTSLVTITATYAETGTASATGGPWLVALAFVSSTS